LSFEKFGQKQNDSLRAPSRTFAYLRDLRGKIFGCSSLRMLFTFFASFAVQKQEYDIEMKKTTERKLPMGVGRARNINSISQHFPLLCGELRNKASSHYNFI